MYTVYDEYKLYACISKYVLHKLLYFEIIFNYRCLCFIEIVTVHKYVNQQVLAQYKLQHTSFYITLMFIPYKIQIKS